MNRISVCIFIWFVSAVTPAVSQKTQRILMYSEYYNPTQVAFVKENSIPNVNVIYQNHFIDTKTGKFSREKLSNYVKEAIPNVYSDELGVLDWEGGDLAVLRGVARVSRVRYQLIVNNFLEAIQFAKKLRPRMKWSFYNFVPSSYPVANLESFKDSSLRDLLHELDFFSTSLYLVDPIISDSKWKIQRYLESNIHLGLEFAKEYGKPFFPFVWHRYKDIEERNALIGIEDFKWYIKFILSVSVADLSVDGIIWWNSESYHYRTRTSNEFFLKEYQGVSFPDYQQNLFDGYYRAIKCLPQKLTN